MCKTLKNASISRPYSRLEISFPGNRILEIAFPDIGKWNFPPGRDGNFEAAIPGDSLSPLFYFCPLLFAVLHWQCCPSCPSSLFLVRTSYTLPSNQFKSLSNSWWLWHQPACVLPLGQSWKFPASNQRFVLHMVLCTMTPGDDSERICIWKLSSTRLPLLSKILRWKKTFSTFPQCPVLTVDSQC